MRVFGLRIGRIPEFLRCVRMSVGTIAAYKQLVRGAWGVLVRRKSLPPAMIARVRYRTCLKCLDHDNEKRRCNLCGCYTPYKTSAEPWGNSCPANEIDQTKGWH